MKSYLQGLITGGVFVFAVMVLMGSTNTKSEVGRYTCHWFNDVNNNRMKVIFDTVEGKWYSTIHKGVVGSVTSAEKIAGDLKKMQTMYE